MISSTISFIKPVISPEKPVPKRASTFKSASILEGISSFFKTSVMGKPNFSAFSRLVLASPLTSSLLAVRKNSTSAPHSERNLPTTNPSPPLFPLPQKIITFLFLTSPKISFAAKATPSPAFSINCNPGMPIPSMVFLSIFLIWEEVTNFIATPCF